MGQASNTYNISLLPGQTKELLVAGGFYKILMATGAVRVVREGGSILQIAAGQGERENFTRLTLQDASGAANTVRLVIASGNFVDDTIYGQVQVIDGSAARSRSAVGYSGGGSLAGVAAQTANTQIFNPAGSGVVAYITDISFSDPVGVGSFSLRSHTAPLATASILVRNKRLDIADHAAIRVYVENNAAPVGVSMGGRFSGIANDHIFHKPTDPYCLFPGYGLSVCNQTLAGALAANFQLYTEPL